MNNDEKIVNDNQKLNNDNQMNNSQLFNYQSSIFPSDDKVNLGDIDKLSTNEAVNFNENFVNNNLDNDINSNSESIIPNEILISSINNKIVDNASDNVNNNINMKVNKNRDEVVYDDGIDTIDEDGKFNIRNILCNKKFLMIISILIFIFVTIVVIKTFYYGDKVDGYEEFFTVIDSKDENSVVISNDDKNNENLKGDAASELINCISSSLDINDLPDSINLVIDEINSYYNQSNNYFSFVYKDLFTGFTVSYNANQSIFAASSIKAPKDIYIWEMASKGLINLDEELTYTGNYYNTGSGVLKNKKINTSYSVRTLLGYSTIDSDNAAHNMLMDKYGRENMLNFWKEKGTNSIFTANTNWGATSGHDAVIYMEELYNFYISDSEYGEAVMNNFINSHPKFLKGKNNYKVASKSGWSGSALHDIAIIFADNPYVVVALSNMGDKGGYNSYFNTVNDLAYKLHTEYWKYKMNLCNSISQYQ